MMAIDSKQIELAEQIDLTRCYEASDRAIAEKRRKERLLAMAASGNDSDKRWYVLRTSNRAERDVHNALTQAGIETWFPIKKAVRTRRFNRPSVQIEVPAFNGYVFVKIVPGAEAWQALYNIRWVSSILCGANGPIAIGDKLISDLMGFVASGKLSDTRKTRHWNEGDKVVFPVGNAGSFEGVVAGYVGTRAVRVFWSLFGSEQVVEVPLAKLQKAD